MVSEKKFRERTKGELQQIGKQVASLATDRDLYRRLEREIVAKNPQLRNSRNPFLAMVRGAYTDAMVIRLAQLSDADNSIGLSLPRVLKQIGEHSELLQDKVGDREFANDCAAVERAGKKLIKAWDPHFSHPTPSALASTHRALDEALDTMISTLETYYWVLAERHLDLEPKYAEDPLAIFRLPWLPK